VVNGNCSRFEHRLTVEDQPYSTQPHVPQRTGLIPVLIEGFTPDEILRLPEEQIEALVLTDTPVVLRAGSAEILGQFRIRGDRLVLELAQIEGGGEGVLPTLWVLTERYARQRGLSGVEWVVHALHCADPNPKLRRLLERRGFVVRDVPGVGEAYYYLHPLTTSPSILQNTDG
jgi:hypothetical protein